MIHSFLYCGLSILLDSLRIPILICGKMKIMLIRDHLLLVYIVGSFLAKSMYLLLNVLVERS